MNGINWMGQLQNDISHFVLAYAGTLVPFGKTLLGIFFVCRIGAIVIKMMADKLNFHHRTAHIGDVVVLILMTAGASTMLDNYVALCHAITSVGVALTNTLNTAIVDNIVLRINQLIQGLPKPSPINMLEIVGYILILLDLALMELAMFVINSFGYVGLGVFGLFGPVLIPFFITKTQSHRFWNWVEGMFGYSLYPAVSAAICLMFSGVYIKFFTSLHSNSIGYLLGMLPVMACLSGGQIYSMFRVHHFIAELKQGMAQAGAAFAAGVGSFIGRLV